MKLAIGSNLILETLAHLKADGARSREGVVLWLGRRTPSHVNVVAVLRPDQEARADMFRIPTASMSAIMSKLRAENLMIGAQVHTHPQEAFHSAADDAWAIVRHVGALSLVLPFFARDTTPESFFHDSATYVVEATGKWTKLRDVASCLEMTP